MAGKLIVPQVKDPEPDMAPMADVAFLLLIYFIVTSNMNTSEADLAMTMPSSMGTGSAAVQIDKMTINVNGLGQILVNDEVLDSDPNVREVPLLIDRLSTYAESAKLTDSEPMVIIAADDSSKGQRFVDVLNALAHETVGISNVTISGFTEDE